MKPKKLLIIIVVPVVLTVILAVFIVSKRPNDPAETIENLKSAIQHKDFDAIHNMVQAKAKEYWEMERVKLLFKIKKSRTNLDLESLNDIEMLFMKLSDEKLEKMSVPELSKFIHENSAKLKEEKESIKDAVIINTAYQNSNCTIADVETSKIIGTKTELTLFHVIKEDDKWKLEGFRFW